METGVEQLLSLPKKTPFCWKSCTGKFIGLLGKENNSEGSSGFEADVEPVDDFLLGISLNFNNSAQIRAVPAIIGTFTTNSYRGNKGKFDLPMYYCVGFYQLNRKYIL